MTGNIQLIYDQKKNSRQKYSKNIYPTTLKLWRGNGELLLRIGSSSNNMARKNDKITDLIQGIGSLWLLGLIVLYFGNQRIFFQVLVLSFIVLGMILGLLILVRKRRFGDIFKWSADQNLLAKLRKMKPDEFEDFIADLYRRLGYSTHRVGGPYDGGIDVTAKKDGVIHYIQCKKFITSKVTLRDIRDFYGAMANNLAGGRGIFITTNIFTTEAINFVRDKPIEIIDGFKLINLIKQTGKNKESVAVENRKCP